MTRHARLDAGRVVEVITAPEDVAITAAFHPSIVSQLVECDAAVAVGWIYADGIFSEPGATTAPLELVKARLKIMIDASAEVNRLKYITPGAGQAMTYQQKVDEVCALALDSEPDAVNYPLLSAEVGITAPSLQEVAAVVLAAYQLWQQIGAAIEGTRLGAKAAIDAAETVEAAEAAADVTWPST